VAQTLAPASARAATSLARNLVAQAAYARALKKELKVLRRARRGSAKATAYRKAVRRHAARLAKLMRAGRKMRLRSVNTLGLGTVTLSATKLSKRGAARLAKLAQPMLRAVRAPAAARRQLRDSLLELSAGGTFDLRGLMAAPALDDYETVSSRALLALAKSL
jgi:hypothetical protein